MKQMARPCHSDRLWVGGAQEDKGENKSGRRGEENDCRSNLSKLHKNTETVEQQKANPIAGDSYSSVGSPRFENTHARNGTLIVPHIY